MYQPVAHDLREKWSEEQEEYVRKNYSGNGSELSNVLPFTGSAIRNKAKRLGVTNQKHFHHVIKTILPEVSKEDLQYIAGFADGEGCFCSNGKRSMQYKFSICNSDSEVLIWMKKMFQIGKVRMWKPRKSHYLPSYTWIVERQGDLWAFSEMIYPFLKVKKKLCKEVLDYLTIRHEKSNDFRRLYG